MSRSSYIVGAIVTMVVAAPFTAAHAAYDGSGSGGKRWGGNKTSQVQNVPVRPSQPKVKPVVSQAPAIGRTLEHSYSEFGHRHYDHVVIVEPNRTTYVTPRRLEGNFEEHTWKRRHHHRWWNRWW